MFDKIPGSKDWIKITPINKGWSKDQKYHIVSTDGKEYLLRISDISLFEKKKKQYNFLKKVAKLKINSNLPISFGVLNNKEIYTLLTWLDGVDAKDEVAKLTNLEQYQLGLQAGQIVALLHSIKIDEPVQNWYHQYCLKIERKIKTLNDCPIKLPKQDFLIQFVKNNHFLVINRPYKFQHGDFHLGNMVINKNGLGIIDFDKNSVADPYDEFKPFCWNVFVSSYFQTGLINGYFNDNIPDDFFPILRLYAAETLISHLPWALSFGEEEVKTAFKVYECVLTWYDDFNSIIPIWYKKP